MAGADDFQLLVRDQVQGLADAPGSEEIWYRSGASTEVEAPFIKIRAMVFPGGAHEDLGMEVPMDRRHAKWPIRVMLFKHLVGEVRPMKAEVVYKGYTYVVKEILWEDAGSWEVYCGE